MSIFKILLDKILGSLVSISNKSFTLTSKQLMLIVLGIIGLICLGLYNWNLMHPDPLREYDKKFNAYQDTLVKPLLDSNKVWKRRSDSADKAAFHARVNADSITHILKNSEASLIALRLKNQRLVDQITNTPTLVPDTCQKYIATINSLNTENKMLTVNDSLSKSRELQRLIENDRTRVALNLQRLRGDSLEHVITIWPMPPKPKTLFGFNLSPKTTFIVGTVAGTVLGAVAVNHFKK